MPTAVKKNLQLIGLYMKVNLSSAMEYRGSFWLQVFGMAINNASFIFFWWVAFDKIGAAVAGYTFRDVMFIWSLSASSFGLARVIFGNLDRLSRIIVSGELDSALLQPRSVLVNVAASRMQVSALGDLGYGFILVLVTYGFSVRTLVLFALFVLLGGIFMAAMAAMFHSLTFFLGNAEKLAQFAVEGSINFCIYPERIFDGLLRVVLYTAIPAGFIVHVPLQVFQQFHLWKLAALVAAAALYAAFAFWLFRAGLRRYESGNRIVTRL